MQAELVSSLQVENQALQAAVERLRHDFQEERNLRLMREKKTGAAGSAASAAAPPSTPARLGIMGRRTLKSRHSLPADVAQTPSRHSGLSGPSAHNHNIRSTPHRARPSAGGVGAAAEAAAAAAVATAAVTAGWESNHGGIGSRHSVPTMAEVESGVANEEGEALPWVLNTDQVRSCRRTVLSWTACSLIVWLFRKDPSSMFPSPKLMQVCGCCNITKEKSLEFVRLSRRLRKPCGLVRVTE